MNPTPLRRGSFSVIYDTVIFHTILEPPRIIEMRDQVLVTMFQNYFDMMWEAAEPVLIK